MTADHDALAKLREPFPTEAVSKLPKGKEDKAKRKSCGTCKGYHDPSMFHLDYVGHAAITDRLLSVDPEWTWEPFATDEHGAPLLERDRNGNAVGLWIRLTVAGMTRPGYGSVEGGKAEAVKELIGDALRNAGMRFGMALDLWHKGDLPDHSDPVPVDLSALDTLIGAARAEGITGDYDTLRAWASESLDNTKAAESKLRKALDKANDPPAGGEDGEAEPSAGDPPADDASPSSPAAGEDAADPVPPTADAAASPDSPYEWQAHAKGRGVRPYDVVKELIKEWPDDDQGRRPNRVADVDRLVADDPITADVVRGLVDDLAGVSA